MSTERVKAYLSRWNRENDVVEVTTSTATVILAAQALGVIPGRIAKSITLRRGEEGALMVVTAGDSRLDNKKFKSHFGFVPKMLRPEDAWRHTGFAVGGICPFALPDGFEIYLDENLRRFVTVFPACGSANSMIEVTTDELAEYSGSHGWVDVCTLHSVEQKT